MSSHDSREQVDCPRCHEQCGWCSDYRWMHGTLRLPNMAGRKNSRCTIPNMEPEGEGCPLCAGSRKVWRTVSYQPIGTECPHSPTGFHIVDTSMETGPNNCFHCEAPSKREGAPLAPLVKAWHATRHAKAGTREAEICRFARGQITEIARMFIDDDEEAGRDWAVAYVGSIMDSGFMFADRRRAT